MNYPCEQKKFARMHARAFCLISQFYLYWKRNGPSLGTVEPTVAAVGDSVEARANLPRGAEAVHHGRAREYAGVNISHEFRLACKQNRSTSQRDSRPV